MLQLNMFSTVTPQNPRPCLHPFSSSSQHFFCGGISLCSPTRTALISSTRNSKRSLSLQCRQSEYYEQKQWSSSPPPSENSSYGSAAGVGASSPRVYAGHSIYKGKAALTVEPRPPEFSTLDSGAYKLSREGFVLLQFAPAAGARVYDWNRKQLFSLSVTEIGTIVGLGARDSCEFFHDPFKGKSDEGKVRKVLKVEPLPDGSGHFFNLTVQNKMLNVDESIYIPITKAEFTVLVSAFNVGMPMEAPLSQRIPRDQTTQTRDMGETMNGTDRTPTVLFNNVPSSLRMRRKSL